MLNVLLRCFIIRIFVKVNDFCKIFKYELRTYLIENKKSKKEIEI